MERPSDDERALRGELLVFAGPYQLGYITPAENWGGKVGKWKPFYGGCGIGTFDSPLEAAEHLYFYRQTRLYEDSTSITDKLRELAFLEMDQALEALSVIINSVVSNK
jgi:hypothetical protein